MNRLAISPEALNAEQLSLFTNLATQTPQTEIPKELTRQEKLKRIWAMEEESRLEDPEREAPGGICNCDCAQCDRGYHCSRCSYWD